MITLSRVDYAYPTGGAALSDLSLSVSGGALAGLVGANGSGKSTLLALLAGLYTPTGGSLRLGGHESPGGEKAIRSLVRLVQQDADLQILGATVEEDLLLGRKRTELAVARAREMAGRFGLEAHWDRPVQTLSWGMKRKLCLAAALLDEPRVLLLDEPFSGLDFPGAREMRAILRANREAGLTQVLSSHDLDSFVDLADFLVVLNQGRLAVAGDVCDVLPHVLENDVRPPFSLGEDLPDRGGR
ncbi:MAG: energy-coupling factor ABC transporter ATP-binding protein [Pseudodesulfovibrio sp.]